MTVPARKDSDSRCVPRLLEQSLTQLCRPLGSGLTLAIALVWPLASLATASAAPAPPRFKDVTRQSGIDFRADFSPTAEKYLVETMGGGVGVLDYNADGWMDLYFPNGARLDPKTVVARGPDKTKPHYWNRLYRNNGNGTFTDVTATAGVAGKGFAMGVAVGDVDNDGWSDLYVTNFGSNELFHNNGNGTFTDVAAEMGVRGEGWSTSAGFFDFDRDGYSDLFVCRYLDWTFSGNKTCRPGGLEQASYCHPDVYPPISNLLFRNVKGKRFEDVSTPSGIARVAGKALGIAFQDFNRDGMLDVAVANDKVPQMLFRNEGQGVFENVALISGAAYDDNGETFAGMGIQFADLDNDGGPDLLITALSLERYALYRNQGTGGFDYVTNQWRLGEITRPYAGWGVQVFDFDGDRRQDVAIAQGHVLDTIESLYPNLKYRQPPLLLQNLESGFADVSRAAGFPQTPRAGRGLAVADLDNDGDLDVVIGNLDGAPDVLENAGVPAHNWIALQLTGTRSNRDAVGTQVAVVDSEGVRQFAMASTSGSYLSARDKRIYFSLGSARGIREILLEWPSGVKQRLDSPRTRQILRIEEPK